SLHTLVVKLTCEQMKSSRATPERPLEKISKPDPASKINWNNLYKRLKLIQINVMNKILSTPDARVSELLAFNLRNYIVGIINLFEQKCFTSTEQLFDDLDNGFYQSIYFLLAILRKDLIKD
ncbi:MAG: hypothetical protein MHPSP_003123, partial [Paramarteilia canceri]